jgi:CubicO group peptidase (beta-lactamase class C family)
MSDSLQGKLETCLQNVQQCSVTEGVCVPGIAAGIHLQGETYFHALGLADLEHAIPMTVQAIHNIASISKVVTAVAAMQLVEAGKLELDADIRSYLPWFPDKGHTITTRHLMTHTSGIRHYVDGEFGPDDVLARQHFTDYASSTKRWRDDALLFAPGTHWYYSSYGSGLLHGIIETVSAMTFENYLRQHLWTPAGMNSTGFDNPYRIVNNRARGYETAPDGSLVNAPFEDLSNRYASGGMISTTEDMLRFGVALNHHKLVRTATLQQMFQPQILATVPDWDKAEGRGWIPALMWELYETPISKLTLGHQGSVRGTNQFLFNIPEHNIVIYIHGNHGDFDATAGARGLLELVTHHL